MNNDLIITEDENNEILNNIEKKNIEIKKKKETIGLIKKFSEKRLKKYDIPARNKLKKCLGDIIEENPDIYGQDFILKIDNTFSKYKYIEVQVCQNWTNKYPYDEMTVYARKGRYEDNTLFITFSNTLGQCYLFDLKGIDRTVTQRLKKYSREMVYVIPWYRCMLLKTDCLDEDTIIMF